MQMSAIATTAFLMPDGFVINPADWMPIVLSKDNTGRYIGAGPFAAAQGPTLWGISGVVTPAQAAGLALVGAFRQASQLFRRNGVSIEASNSHADFFIKNLVAIRGEERLALAVYREGAFGQVDLTAGALRTSGPGASPARGEDHNRPGGPGREDPNRPGNGRDDQNRPGNGPPRL